MGLPGERRRVLPPVLKSVPFPAFGAPLFIVGNPKLVVAQCTAGIVGSMPALDARPAAQLDEWLAEIGAGRRAGVGIACAPMKPKRRTVRPPTAGLCLALAFVLAACTSVGIGISLPLPGGISIGVGGSIPLPPPKGPEPASSAPAPVAAPPAAPGSAPLAR